MIKRCDRTLEMFPELPVEQPKSPIDALDAMLRRLSQGYIEVVECEFIAPPARDGHLNVTFKARIRPTQAGLAAMHEGKLWPLIL